MKNRFKKAASVLLTLTLALGVAVIAPLTAAAAQTASDSTAAGITVLDITAQDIRSAKEQELKEIPDAAMRKGDGKAIQDALDLAHERATDANPYLVRVQAGSYDMVSSLIIYSNTTLSLYGVTLNHRADADHPSFNLLRIGDFDVLEEGTNIYKTGAVGYCQKRHAEQRRDPQRPQRPYDRNRRRGRSDRPQLHLQGPDHGRRDRHRL